MNDNIEVILGRIEARLAAMEAKLDRAISDGADHERRLRVVERWMWAAVGMSGAGLFSGLWSMFGGA